MVSPRPLATAGDVLTLQRQAGNRAVQGLVAGIIQRRPRRRRRDIRGLPFHLPMGSDVVAAEKLHLYLVGEKSKTVSAKQKKRIVQRYLGGKSKRWLRGVEKSYNHQWYNSYLLLNFKGTPYEFGLWQASGKRPASDSPFRKDLKTALGGDADSYVAALEKALRLKPLSGKEHASALLSSKQRKVAISRAQGKEKELAKWLFSEKTWVYLVSNHGSWVPSTKGGFFELPDSSQRGAWPKSKGDSQQGDKAYLQQIRGNMKQIEKSIDQLKAEICGAGRMAGMAGAGGAAQAYQWAIGKQILEYREKLRTLLKVTEPGIDKVMPIKEVWGPKPKRTSEFCKK